ncbi:helix-turn-helix transcriptional regulator [Nocardioides sp. zg-1308]|uniref:Helix-turn-helix domain-containing protein n=1 Tax=Nocardioides renjunii TaxID=3095075 RepID=A0ABU5K8F6_9ACTN|nr:MULTISPECIES: helix-turn-helix domain-containing protein [unclassified Nocardioides]MDZ5660890.1 helix-turn-helix domain-containing protein [Nocardioides sp. S-58]NPD04012.1 helix-turn-helix transcriptional regulator [Nocardioides sp. zg-1308]
MPEPQPLSDPRVLRAIAHPVRTRILEELSATGPVRAADVARELGIPANQASFHLRQLAKYGLVEEAPEEARDKRDRVWRATSAEGFTVNLKQLTDAPGGAAAVDVFRASKLAQLHELVERTFVLDRPEGSGVFSTSDHAIKLTDEEAHQLRQDLDDVVQSWVDRTRGRAPGRRTYHLVHIVQPYPEGGAPE